MLRLCAVLFCAFASAAACEPFAQLLADSHADVKRYFSALRRAYAVWGAHAALCAVLIVSVSCIALRYPRYAALALGASASVLLLRFGVSMLQNTQRSFSARDVGCFCLCAALDAALCAGLLPVCAAAGAGALLLPAAFAPFVTPLAVCLQKLFDAAKQARMYQKAARRMARLNAVTGVAVAGERGGELCAHILCSILSQQGSCARPQVFFDVASLCEAVLSPETMSGALVACLPVQDAAQSARMVRMLAPRIVILTDQTTPPPILELLRANLPHDAIGVCRADASVAPPTAVQRTFGLGKQGDFTVEDLCFFTDGGARFQIADRLTSQTVRCYFPLIGAKSVEAACAAAAAARLFEMDDGLIAQSLSQVPPLQGHMSAAYRKGVLWIDNTKEERFSQLLDAMETLGGFDARRIVVLETVQNGQDDLNERAKAVGECAARCADAVLLVGAAQADAVSSGLLEGGLAREKLYIARNAEEAAEKQETIVAVGDVVLQVFFPVNETCWEAKERG